MKSRGLIASCVFATLPKQNPKHKNTNEPNIIIPYNETNPPVSWISSTKSANQSTTDNCIRTMTSLAKTIEIMKALGMIGVTKSLLRIPLLLYSTKLNPLPAILRFINMNASSPGIRKSMYL